MITEPEIKDTDLEFVSAINTLRSGEIDKGLQMLELVKNQKILRNLAKSEIMYWKQEYREAMYLDEHSLTSDHLWTNAFVVPQHLRAYVIAAKKLGAISRAKEFLDYYIAQKRKQYDLIGARPFNKIYTNAMHRLDDIPAKDEPKKAVLVNEENATCKFIMYGNKDLKFEINDNNIASISMLLTMMWFGAETSVVLDFYEQFADHLTDDTHHINAARNYILLQDHENTHKALVRYIKLWKPTESFQVMPMKIFIYNDIIDYMTTEMYEEFLKMNKNTIQPEP